MINGYFPKGIKSHRVISQGIISHDPSILFSGAGPKRIKTQINKADDPKYDKIYDIKLFRISKTCLNVH